ncbi:MAG: organic solvent transporter [Verrucomicrobiaceae bacterium]|nr:organic solvent transporter [Verrucomicrobiaceae bacterium]
MTVRQFLSVFFVLPCFFATAADTSSEAQQRLHGAVDEVLHAAESAKSKASLVEHLRPILEKHISFNVMTRRAVGPGWRQFSAEEQAKATQLFTTLIIRSYSNKFTLGEHPAVQYQKAATPAPGRVDVATITVYQGSRYSVTYRMEQEEGWHITDVVIEGVSMIANYRSQLDAAFKKGGASTVLSSLSESISRPQ